MVKRVLVILIFFAIAFAVFVYLQSPKRKQPVLFSPYTTLTSTWSTYKNNYYEYSSGRTIDKQNDITTSEAQSYTMLRAVWMDDKDTFDQSWKWTKENLQRPDKLFSWKYGTKEDGTQGILPAGGENSASDADNDIALSLIFAYTRWRDRAYIDEALPILNSAWENEVVIINGKPYLASNNIEKTNNSDLVLLNPSYFAPYAYRIFALLDTQHDWVGLVDTSYDVINQSMSSVLNTSYTAGLPPDWVYIDRNTGILKTADNGSLTSNYSYDALRTPFRLALDYQWYGDPRAKATLEKMAFFKYQWENYGFLNAGYRHNGQPLVAYEAPAYYGAVLGYFKVADPMLAKDVYDKKVKVLYNPDFNSWREKLSYYDDNWVWFGLAYYYDFLPNLSPEKFDAGVFTTVGTLTGTAPNPIQLK